MIKKQTDYYNNLSKRLSAHASGFKEINKRPKLIRSVRDLNIVENCYKMACEFSNVHKNKKRCPKVEDFTLFSQSEELLSASKLILRGMLAINKTKINHYLNN